MPVVRVSWFEGKDSAAKQAVAAEITESIVKNTGTAAEYMTPRSASELRHYARWVAAIAVVWQWLELHREGRCTHGSAKVDRAE